MKREWKKFKTQFKFKRKMYGYKSFHIFSCGVVVNYCSFEIFKKQNDQSFYISVVLSIGLSGEVIVLMGHLQVNKINNIDMNITAHPMA